tara:strand:+ start:1033 stop:1284 length:252 start_codon:yes stop_codon:yes gene_type:complete
MNNFKDSLKTTDEAIAWHAERLAIAELKRDYFKDLATMANNGGYWDERMGFVDVDIYALRVLAADFNKAAKQGLDAVKKFLGK